MTGIIRENLGLKLFSLAIALLLEIYFYSPDNSVIATISASIQVRDLPQSMMVVWPPVGDKALSAKVTVRGPAPLVKQIEGDDHRFFVDLPKPTPVSFRKNIQELLDEQLRFPSGISIVRIEPEMVELKLERVVRKELLVKVITSGEPEPGYAIEKVEAFPETVFARGPQSELDGLPVVETQKVDVSGFRSSNHFDVPLVERGALTTLGINVVRVEVTITPILAEKTLNRVAIDVISPQNLAASVRPSAAQVVLSGPDAVLNKLKEKDLKLVANATMLPVGEHELGLEAKLPADVKIVKTIPEKVTVNLVGKNGE